MDPEKDTNSSGSDPSDSSSSATATTQHKSINLLKRSKHDLLRLLSILEGELEARDIFISTLQAQLNNKKNAKQQYYVHRLNDPFLSLHRDDYVTGSGENGDRIKKTNELIHIEPLPLLEKVIHQFKSQQQKMHQQMTLASKIHRKMAHELAEEKRKHAFDTKTGDDVTMALEKERERLRASVMCEKERTKRIEKEYKKLLALCKEEGRKHKIIVMALLAEQERLLQQLKQSRELQIDIDSTETELHAKLHEALKEKQDLAVRLKEEQVKCSGLKTKVTNLERKMSQLKNTKPTPNSNHHKSALEQAAALYACGNVGEEEEDIAIPELPVKMSRAGSSATSDESQISTTESLASFFSKHHPMSVAQSTQDVTLIPTSSHPPIQLADGVGITTSGYYSVKPGSSIAGLDAMKSSATNKEMLSLDFSRDDVFEAAKSELNEKITDPVPPNGSPKPAGSSGPPKPNRFIPGSPHYIPFRSPHSLFNERSNFSLASSPTSGAANFAMNSPNSPSPPHTSSFAITRSSSVKASTKFHVTKIEPPTKLSMYPSKNNSSPARNPIKPGQNSTFQNTRMKFQTSGQSSTTVNTEIEQTTSKENMVAEKRFQGKKFTPVTYKSHISQKVSGSLPIVAKSGTMTKHEIPLSEVDRIKQPLPPKTKPTSAPAAAGSQVRPPPLPPKKPSLSSEKSVTRSSTSDGGKTEESRLQRSGSKKRTEPLSPSLKANENGGDSNMHSTRDVKGPAPPTLPAKMSSQQPTPPGSRQSLSGQHRKKPSSES